MSQYSNSDSILDEIQAFQSLCYSEFAGIKDEISPPLIANSPKNKKRLSPILSSSSSAALSLDSSSSSSPSSSSSSYFTSSPSSSSPIFNKNSTSPLVNLDKVKGLSILERFRLEEKMIVEVTIAYRLSVLRQVGIFAHLSPEIVETTALCLEELKYDSGDSVIRQDDAGDGFYILEEGLVEVSKKKNSNDKREIAVKLATLGKNATFGELSLISDEPRSATVTVVSPKARCLRLGRAKFQEIMAMKNKAVAEVRSNIASDVINMVPIFKGISGSQKQKLLNAMVPVDFWPNSFIVRQGSIGTTFYIITEGNCKVTINTDEGKEMKVATLRVGDFFGEIALMELSNKRTASVISLDNVSVLSLNKVQFQKLFKNLKNQLLENQAVKRMVGVNSVQPLTLLSTRRISGFDHHNLKHKERIKSLYKRFCKVVVESLWSSLYSRMYIKLVLLPNKLNEYGGVLEQLMSSDPDRWTAVCKIQKAVIDSLSKSPINRSMSDHSLIIGLMGQRNQLRGRVCKDWSRNEYIGLCRKVGYASFPPMRKMFEIDGKGSHAFLLLRGNIRVFKKVKVGTGFKMVYEEDLCSGDMLCEDQLNGIVGRTVMAFTLTPVELITIEYNDFQNSQDRATSILSHDERTAFLMHAQLLKGWEPYKISRLALTVLQQEAFKGQKVLQRGGENRDLIFLLNGRLDVVTNTIPPCTITTINKHEYVGETGFLNSRDDPTAKAGDVKPSYREKFNVIALTRVDMLVIPYEKFEWLTNEIYSSVKSGYFEKVKWREERNETILYEKRNGLEASTTLMLNSMQRKKEQMEVESNKQHDAFIRAEIDAIHSPGTSNDYVANRLDSTCDSDGDEDDNTSVDGSSEFLRSPSSKSSTSTTTTTGTSLSLKPLVEESMAKIANHYHSPTLTHDIDPFQMMKEVRDLEDIPSLVYKGFGDPHMILPTLTTFREINHLRQNLKSVQGPKITRTLKKSAKGEGDLGFSSLHSEFFNEGQLVTLADVKRTATLDDLRPKSLHEMDASHLDVKKKQQIKVNVPLLALSPPLRKPQISATEEKLQRSLPFGVDSNKFARQKGCIKSNIV